MKKYLFFFSLIFVLFNFIKVDADSLVLEKYELGETLSFSKSDNVEYFLETPSCKTLYGYEFLLDEIGKYELTKRSKKDNSFVIDTKSFIVNQAFCDVSSDSSSVDLSKKGLAISLSEGDSATINKILDLRNVTKDDELFKLEITPDGEASADFTIITISFIDVEDSNSYLKVLLQSSPDNKFAAYALAGATNQPLTGYEAELGRLHKNNQWGAFFPLSFYGMAGANKVIDIRFDSVTKEVFSTPGYRIIDLDDPDFFSNKWNGFTSGKVKVKITASSYLKNSAHILLKSYGNNPIDSIYAVDNECPAISIDVDKFNVPNGVIGKPYPLFDVDVIDEGSGVVRILKSVYRNYRKTNQYNVSIDNNAFVPEEVGVYTIEYKAYDKFGNVGINYVDVNVVDKNKPITLSIIKSSQVTEGNLGELVKLADYYVNGGCGKVNVDISVKFNGEDVLVTDGMFRPEYEGVYDIVYKASDYLGNQVVTVYNFKGNKTDVPYFANDPVLPRYFINGKTYILPEFFGVDYSSGSKRDAKASIYLEVDGKKECVDGKEFTINTDGDSVKVIYVIGNYELVKDVEVINVGKQDSLDLGKYFIGDAVVLATDNGISISGSDDSSIAFIKEVLALDFQIKLNMVNGNNVNSISIYLTDTEYKNQSVKFTFEKYADKSIFLINDKKLYELSENGFTSNSQSNELTLSFDGSYVNPFGNVYLAINNYLNNEDFKGFSSNKVYVDIVTSSKGEYEYFIKNLCGQPLNTTNKDRIKPLIVINGKYGGEYNIDEVVLLNPAIALDVLDPNINFSLSVINPNGGYVLDVNGLELNGVDPNKLYEFKTEDYGYYNIIYTASDFNNKQDKTFSYSIICEDKIKPNVIFKVNDEVKINEKVIIKDLKYSDNYSEKDSLMVYAYIVLPNGENVLMSEGYYSFTPKYAGIYKVVVYVYDEAFNIGMYEMMIKVVE